MKARTSTGRRPDGPDSRHTDGVQTPNRPTEPPPNRSRQPIVLIGFMGSGKTAVGRRLAALLDAGFADSDTRIETTAGRPISAIFAWDGEAAFRALEHTVVVGLLDSSGRDSSGQRHVLALGGGAAMHPDTRAALRGAAVVHLRVSLAEALRRVGDDPTRPMLARPDLAELHALRETAYDRLADLVVDVDGRTVDDVAHHLARRLAELGLAGVRSPTEVGLGDDA